MKKICLVFVLCLCFHSLIGQNGNDISIGKIDSFDSKILNEKRKIWIHVPDGNYQDLSKTKKYPVLYLLDGNSHFYSVVGMIRQLSSSNRNTVLPKMIVVGIPNTNRTRDLSPTKGKHYNGDSATTNSGGGDKFMSFIENELIPYIDSNYPTESYRTFVGHSLGGLTVMNTLINNPELFKSYVAIDPSMWWNNKNLLKKIKNTKLDKRYNGRTLFLGIANTAGMDTLSVQRDTTYKTRHLRTILELNSFLKNKDNLNYLSYEWKYYEEESHASVPLITTYDALRYIFNFYQLDIDEQDLIDPEKDILNKIKNHYQRISKEYGREIIPEHYFIENLAHQLVDKKQLEKAERFFIYNTTNYPKNPYLYNRLGDFYINVGNIKKAVENYKKSFSLDENSYSRDKIKVLQK
ncbi:alpha/beta hydrolase-fold protein [Winogradskyella sp.]|uniref:alpha/beta hydrolase-fold protein n=1 Tax=Winogradskyella sp. TaxID=1883156 RepID=UPI00261E57F8|nr:alpha/beta hydrolase-fold protein [Winogradskyella sp.]